jgi:hypothetical protein
VEIVEEMVSLIAKEIPKEKNLRSVWFEDDNESLRNNMEDPIDDIDSDGIPELLVEIE